MNLQEKNSNLLTLNMELAPNLIMILEIKVTKIIEFF